MSLDGKIAVITGCGSAGGGSRLGAEYAIELAHQGARVVVTDIKALDQVCERLSGFDFRSIELDLSNSVNCTKLMDFAANSWPEQKVDILVNNAGIGPNTTLETKNKIEMYRRHATGETADTISLVNITDADWLKFWDVNVHASFWCLREALKYMTPNRYGRIINISSISSFTHLGGFSPGYAASKAAVHGLTLSVAEECARFGVLVNTFAPSGVITPEWNRLPVEQTTKISKTIPIGRLADYSDYTKIVAMLAGDHYFVGQLLSPNGGIVI